MHLFKVKSLVLKFLLGVLTFGVSALMGSVSALASPILEEALVYKNADIELSQISKDQSHRIVLSAPKRINNAEFIENEKRIAGEKKVLLTKLTSSETINQAFAYYQSYIADHGKIEFVCEKRACGINSYWANSILDERRVSARDSDQYYVAGQIEIAGVHYWLSVYLVTNALRQNFVHVTYIRHEALAPSWENAYLLFSGSTLPAALLQSLQQKLNSDPQLILYIATYSSLNSTPSLQTKQTELRSEYELMRDYLEEALSISPKRMMHQFVGPFHAEPATGKELWFRLFLLKP